MAPVDRRDHRQQRVRGAGQSSVQASFGFDFGALAARPAKQSSLPPQRSSRRTPVHRTPRGASGSAQRHRSASVQRSTVTKRRLTPRERTVTPHLGKRKRGFNHAQVSGDEEEPDELSPDREENVRSIEKSRRAIGTALPITQEFEDAPDELSILEEGASSARKLASDASYNGNGTPVATTSRDRVSSSGHVDKTPIASTNGRKPNSRRVITRRSKSTEPAPVTPGMLPVNRTRSILATRSAQRTTTPSIAEIEEDLSDDELSTPKENEATPRVVAQVPQSEHSSQVDEDTDVDELSTQIHSTPIQQTTGSVVLRSVDNHQKSRKEPTDEPRSDTKSSRLRRVRRVVEEDEDEVAIETTTASVTHKSPVQPLSLKTKVETKKLQRKTRKAVDLDKMMDREPDELSPEVQRVRHQPVKRMVEAVGTSSDDSSYEREESESEEETLDAVPRPISRSKSPQQAQPLKVRSDKPPRKRRKFSGPIQAISVMRIKGSAIKGITIADTTRTIIEQSIDNRLARMIERVQSSQDSTHRRELRAAINLALSFKESLNEKLLDLQDANDVLSANLKKLKISKRDNATLRKDILAAQNSRQEIALEHDDVQAEFDAEKERVEARNMLSTNMFDIEAAIRNGRERARKEGREDEGPDMPLRMLLDTVGRNVGSRGGGLLAGIQSFNGELERAAGWLEGRA